MKTKILNCKWWSRAVLSAVAAMALLVSAPVSAWGPERPTYTMDRPAEKAVFNSIIDNAAVGDERDFVRIAEVNSGQPFTSELELQPGKEYIVMIYFHNDASATFNDAAHGRVGFAENVRVMSYFPPKLEARERGKVDGLISTSNTDPREVWDEAYITASEAMTLHYVQDSATLNNQKAANGSKLSTKLFTSEGVLIGTNKLNGLIPGCDEYAGEVFYRFRTEAVEKPAPEPEPEPEPGPEPEPEPTPEPEPIPEVPEELPETGPAEIVLAVVVVMLIVAGGIYWWRTSHEVKKTTKKAKGKKSKKSRK